MDKPSKKPKQAPAPGTTVHAACEHDWKYDHRVEIVGSVASGVVYWNVYKCRKCANERFVYTKC